MDGHSPCIKHTLNVCTENVRFRNTLHSSSLAGRRISLSVKVPRVKRGYPVCTSEKGPLFGGPRPPKRARGSEEVVPRAREKKQTPSLISVLGHVAGDMMVDGVIPLLVEVRPLVLSGPASEREALSS